MDQKLIINHVEHSLDRADRTVARLVEDIQGAVADWTPERVHSHLGGPLNVASRISELAVAVASRNEIRAHLDLLKASRASEESAP